MAGVVAAQTSNNQYIVIVEPSFSLKPHPWRTGLAAALASRRRMEQTTFKNADSINIVVKRL